MRTEQALNELVETLQSNCGDFYGACKTCRVSPGFVSKWMKDDPKVHDAISEAKNVGALGLEHAAMKRAVEGVEKEVYYQGEVVGSETVYSDGLLTTLMKGRLKSVYGAEANQTNVNIHLLNQIQAMPRANSYQEWLTMAETKALPAPDPEDVPFEVLMPSPQMDPNMVDIL